MYDKVQIPLPTHVNEEEFARLVDFARRTPLTADTVVSLANRLAESGDFLTWPSTYRTVDIASTGGPGSLSTLLPPLALQARGYSVVKLAVPGRPAGAIDSLGTLNGYRPGLSGDEVRAVVDRCGFAHFLADERFAPLDAALFSYRRRVDAVALPLLAAASLLSKKLAVGVKTVGLDIRVGIHGNFGTTRDAARRNAVVFCEAASLLGMRAVAFIGPNVGAVQPFIGRGEALIALAIAAGIHLTTENPWLADHVRDCYEMVRRVALLEGGCLTQNKPQVNLTNDLRTALEGHLAAQGSSIDAFNSRVASVSSTPRQVLRAPQSGRIDFDLDVLRRVIVTMQADGDSESFADPAGVELLVPCGQEVSRGEEIALLRCEAVSSRDHFAHEIAKAVIVHTAVGEHEGVSETMEIVDA